MDRVIYYYFNIDIMARYLPDLLAGLIITLQMATLIVLIGVSSGLFLATVRSFRLTILNSLLISFVNVIRAIPDLVLIIFVFFGLPYVGIRLDPFPAAVLSLSLILAVFSEEIFWAGITSIDRGQWDAGRSTGLSFFQVLQSIVAPQAVRLSIPPLTNQILAITKATSLASVVSVPEILNRAASAQSEAANPSPLMLAAILFIVIFFPLVRLSRYLEKRFGGWQR